ncbi:MAG: hypothetical protein JJU06_05700 [Ectothiorhodospiraceae bacterium]|nr:hypothetical protein [Ectothiorhodospiraceae bacterium]MCH8502931.1 hypothetical protein [Ectothiorhodospiraceae bacterium]
MAEEQQSNPIPKSTWLWAAVIGVGIGLFIFWHDQASAPPTTLTEGAVRVACHDAMRDQLRAPSRASFPGAMSANGNRVDWVREGELAQYRSWVDAENALGGTIRVQFQCEVTNRSGRAEVTHFTAQER